MWSASAAPVLSLAGFWWPWGPDRVRVDVGPGDERRVHLLEPTTGWSLWVDPSLPAPAKEGPLGAEAQALREVADGGSLSHLRLVLEGPHEPAPGSSVARRVATLAALRGAVPELRDAAERAVLSGRPQAVDGARLDVSASALAWLDARLLLFRERVVESPAAQPPAAEPRLDPASPEAYWAQVAGVGLASDDSERSRQRLQVLAGAGLHAQWTLAAIRGRAVHLGLCAPERRDALCATLREYSYELLPCKLADVRGLELEPGATP